jgi:hypothetical protein
MDDSCSAGLEILCFGTEKFITLMRNAHHIEPYHEPIQSKSYFHNVFT